MEPVTVEQFRGLRLLPEQGEAPGSVSMLNADLSRDFTQIGTRGGMSRLGTGTASYHRIAPLSSSQLAVARNNGSGLVFQTVALSGGAFGTASTAYGSASTVATSILSAGSGTIAVAARSGASNETARVWDGTTLLTSAELGGARYLAISPIDTSFIAAHYTSATATASGANGTTSTVWFGPAGDLSGGVGSFRDDDWIKLDPGDGDPITGMVVWRDQVYVIKRAALYVLSSVSTDGIGGRQFNFRRVELPARARVTTNGGGENIVAGGDGVYLLLADGVYRTTGDTPVLVSRDISPLFNGTGDSAMLFPSSGDWTIGYATNRLYISYQVGSTYRTLLYDTILREWLLWDVAVGASAVPTNVIEWVDTNGLPTGYVAAGAKVFSFTKTATSDDGTAIVSSYQSGFDGLGYPSQEKRLRNLELVGSGTPTLDVFTDYATSDPLSRSGTVTLGTAPAIATAVHNKAYRGRLFSFKVSASTGQWTLTRLTWMVGEVRPAGLRTA